MAKYIEKNALVAEIEKLQDSTTVNGHFRSQYYEGIFDGLSSIERFINTLDVEETRTGTIDLMDKALAFIVETQESNDYICGYMTEEFVGDYCKNNCCGLNKECVKLFLQKVYKA